MPLLRQSKLKPRPAKILKWEGIIVDPLGVLLAVFAFEIISFFTSGSNNVDTLLLFFFGSALAVLLGWFSGRSLGWMFETRSEERRVGKECRYMTGCGEGMEQMDE